MRLIDADALIPIMKYTTIDNEIGVFPIRIGFNAIKGVIDEAPTIDAIEVVRCKNCKYWASAEDYDCEIHSGAFGAEDFCSYGERRDESEVE